MMSRRYSLFVYLCQVKLRRLLRYMQLKDMKAALNRASSVEEEDPTPDTGPEFTLHYSVLCFYH